MSSGQSTCVCGVSISVVSNSNSTGAVGSGGGEVLNLMKGFSVL